MTTALQTDRLSKNFGGFSANMDISLSFAVGGRYALIGPNGAGKTTFINLLTGALEPTSGRIFLGGEDVTALPQHQRVKRGMARTFQINTLFPGLTVLESLMLSICERKALGGMWMENVSARREEIDEALNLLKTLHLEQDANILTRNLPYGKQRLLEIALALTTRPKIFLLDEPAAGIPAAHSRDVFAVIEKLSNEVTIIFVEHDMGLVFRFAEHIVVLVGGKVLTQGSPTEIAKDRRVKEVYLGEPEHV